MRGFDQWNLSLCVSVDLYDNTRQDKRLLQLWQPRSWIYNTVYKQNNTKQNCQNYFAIDLPSCVLKRGRISLYYDINLQ